MNFKNISIPSLIQDYIVTPMQVIPSQLKEMLDEFISLKPIYKWVLLLLVVYFAVPPLLYQEDPVQFHLVKLNTMYIVGALLVLTVLIGYQHFPNMRGLWDLYKKERLAVFVMLGFMLFSLAINYPQMNLFVRAKVVSTNVFYGAGPNFISIFYYWLGFLLLFSIPIVLDHIPFKLLASILFVAVTITGLIIAYQILVFDFIGVARTYLFGFGNSNYTPDAFAIFGLYLLIPLLYKEKINIYHTVLGLFMFVIVLLSLSRASWVGLTLAALATLVYLIARKKVHWARLGGISLLGVVVLGSLAGILILAGEDRILSDFLSLINIFSEDVNLAEVSSLRTPLWGSAIDMWLYGSADGSEVFGLNFATIFFGNGQSVYVWVDGSTQYLVTNVHQMFLDVLMSAGIVTFGLFVWLLARSLKYVYILVEQNIQFLPLFAGFVYIMGKWLFNSLNGLHAPFVYTVFILIYYFYYKYLGQQHRTTLLRK